MAKATDKTPDHPQGSIAVAEPEEEFIEIPVLDKTDEELLSKPAEADETAEGAEEERAEAETPEPPKAAAKKPTPPAKAEAPKAEAKVPEPKPEPPKAEKPERPPLTPIERAEREKRKEYARKWQAALEEQERLQTRIAQLQREVRVGELKLPEERLRALRGRLKETLKDASELDQVAAKAVEESLGEATYLLQERDKQWQQEFERMQLLQRIHLSWLGARVAHPDFQSILSQSGLLSDISERPDGTYANPYLARRVYLSADPGEEAYQLALGRLESTQSSDPNDRPEREEQPSPQRGAEPEPTKAEPTSGVKPDDAEAAAERRGAKRVIEEVESIAKKPKGIANLQSASGPKTQWTKADLDRLMRTNPERYETLMRRFPELERFHLS